MSGSDLSIDRQLSTLGRLSCTAARRKTDEDLRRKAIQSLDRRVLLHQDDFFDLKLSDLVSDIHQRASSSS